jgi:hypothetical protein
MLLKIPKRERYGTVRVDILSTCRPKVHKVLHITFERGIISEALDYSWNFAHKIPELVPAAAQEAERRLEEAKRSLETASDNLKTSSDNLCRDISSRLYNTHRSLCWIKTGIRDRVNLIKHGISKKVETVANVEAMQQQAEIDLLSAQIRAKLWWLKLTAGKEEHDRYHNAAEQFLANKVRKSRGLQKPKAKVPEASSFGRLFWPWCSSNYQNKQQGKKA